MFPMRQITNQVLLNRFMISFRTDDRSESKVKKRNQKIRIDIKRSEKKSKDQKTKGKKLKHIGKYYNKNDYDW